MTTLNDSNFQLRCEVCGRLRPPMELHVAIREGLLYGTKVARNVTHCYDDIDCVDRARAMAEEFVAKFEVTQ